MYADIFRRDTASRVRNFGTNSVFQQSRADNIRPYTELRYTADYVNTQKMTAEKIPPS